MAFFLPTQGGLGRVSDLWRVFSYIYLILYMLRPRGDIHYLEVAAKIRQICLMQPFKQTVY